MTAAAAAAARRPDGTAPGASTTKCSTSGTSPTCTSRSSITCDSNDECRQAQYDECLSLSLIYPDEFRLLSGTACDGGGEGDGEGEAATPDLTLLAPEDLVRPVRFSVRLRPASAASDDGTNGANDELWPPDRSFALVATYPPSYPDAGAAAPPAFSFSAALLHPLREEACLASVAAAVRPDLAARNPCGLAAVAAARRFFLDGGLRTDGLLRAVGIGEDVLAAILAYAATDADVVDNVVRALPAFEAVRRRNEVWEQLCRRRWRTKWGYERRMRAALAEEKDFRRRLATADATAAEAATWWYDRYAWQEEDARRNAITLEELTDPGCVWDTRRYFKRSTRDNPDHMKDVRMSGLRRSAEKVHFGLHPEWEGRLPRGTAREKALGAGPLRNLLEVRGASAAMDSGGTGSTYWCLGVDDDDPRPQVVTLYIRRDADRMSGASSFGVQHEVRRLDTWGWEIRDFQRVSRAIHVDLPFDGDEPWDAKAAAAEEARFEEQLRLLWSDYLDNLITEERPVWIKQEGEHGRRPHELNYREIPDSDDLKAFLPW